MKKYLVGGAVRDSLLNLPIKERDWVVTGSNTKEMLKMGYEQVGKDFPVFLHPKNHEEYALARTERKSGTGYTGFICHTSPSVTIEEDLYRRDLTINAMAYDMHNNLLDPYNGQKDIKLRLLRHVSNSFHEDPLRVLRVARFAAQFEYLGFTIAPETLHLMRHMLHELISLSVERVWMETKKALMTKSPQIYFQVLRKCGALKILFPELDILFNKPYLKKNYLNINNFGDYTMIKLSKIAYLNNSLDIRFAILCCNIEHKINLTKLYKKYHQHVFPKKQLQNLPIDNLCNRLKIPRKICKLAKIVSIYNIYLHNTIILSPTIILSIFDAFNCWKCPKNIDQLIFINKFSILEENRHCCAQYLLNQAQFLRKAFTITTQIKINNIIKDGFTHSKIKQELYSRRIHLLTLWISKTKN